MVDPRSRPTFAELKKQFEKMCEDSTRYLDIQVSQKILD